MKAVKIASFLVIILAFAAIVFRACVIKIQPGESGVLNKQWGGGLQKKDYEPGFYLNLGPLHTWNVMDTTVQTLHMLRKTPGKAKNRRGQRGVPLSPDYAIRPPIKVKSSDGADVTLDISIKYQIAKGKAWKVFANQGGRSRYKDQVASRTKKTLISGLGGLTTEQFFDPSQRTKTQSEMEKQLSIELAKIDVDLVTILIRDLEFQKSFQDRIKAKTLTTQKKEVEIARTKAAEFAGITKEISAQTTAKVAVIEQTLKKTLTELRAENDKKIQRLIADYKKYVTETQSKAQLYAQKKEAEGIKLLKDAEARGQALRRDALASEGGGILVALRAVENMSFGDISVSTQQINPLDFDAMMRRLGATPK